MEAKLAPLEEEVSILNGEVKAILQEVKIAVLASENPFTSVSPRPQVVAIPARKRTEASSSYKSVKVFLLTHLNCIHTKERRTPRR